MGRDNCFLFFFSFFFLSLFASPVFLLRSCMRKGVYHELLCLLWEKTVWTGPFWGICREGVFVYVVGERECVWEEEVYVVG